MVDTHYDLLSICYVCYLKNDYTKIEEIANKIKNNNGNIKCIFANLYFMSEDEMKEELHANYYNPDVPVLVMFRVAKHILNHYLPDVEFIYSIEGCDYINIDYKIFFLYRILHCICNLVLFGCFHFITQILHFF